MTEQERAADALQHIKSVNNGNEWLQITMAFKAAGGDYDTWNKWCSSLPDASQKYIENRERTRWNSLTAAGGITAKTLFYHAKNHGWTPPAGHTERTSAPRSAQQTAEPQPKKEKEVVPERAKEISAEIERYAKNRAQALPYLKTRGITAETAERFNIGYNPQRQTIVIPHAETAFYTERYTDTAPNIPNSEGQRYRNLPGAKKTLFNLPALNSGAEIVCITEGAIDAISIEQSGGAAVASNETAQILNAISDRGTTAKQFFILQDADATGTDKAQKMQAALQAAGLNAFIFEYPAGYHDANDFLVKAEADFIDWLRNAPNWRADQYRAKAGGLASLAALDAQIERKEPVISTGFLSLDVALSGNPKYPGGLMAGLYALGAIPALGKTTLVIQMADSIAQSGHDVLFIALEMAKTELTARSISRITREQNSDYRLHKTEIGISNGNLYQYYSQQEIDAINRAKARYRQFAPHLFIFEGVGNIDAATIENLVAEHKKIMGRAPVVIVDYLQIIAPADVRATDKVNTDKAILTLKRISRDYQTPVIIISSFNRTNYKTAVSQESFKESGGIDYGVDVMIGLQLEGAGSENFDVDAAKALEPRKIEAVILKNRRGKHGNKVLFDYEANNNYFRDVMNGAVYAPSDRPAPIACKW